MQRRHEPLVTGGARAPPLRLRARVFGVGIDHAETKSDRLRYSSVWAICW
jgi:hypothetical protein